VRQLSVVSVSCQRARIHIAIYRERRHAVTLTAWSTIEDDNEDDHSLDEKGRRRSKEKIDLYIKIPITPTRRHVSPLRRHTDTPIRRHVLPCRSVMAEMA
jgi:hypothetical protein